MEDNLITDNDLKIVAEQIRDIYKEGFCQSRLVLVETYHQIGQLIFSQSSRYLAVKDLARLTNISERTLYYATQLYEKWPDLITIPEGKNISWNKLITKYLPEPKKPAPIPLPEGKYDVIYLDPPWQYSNSGISGAADNHYPTMSIEELSELRIPSTDNATMFVWVTNPILFEALPLIEKWGFEYKTNMVWIKDIAGQGFYVKGQHELLLICTKGQHRPDDTLYIRSVVQHPRLEHSQKPEVFYEIIEKLYPEGKYLEMFARNKRQGWTSWGNEI